MIGFLIIGIGLAAGYVGGCFSRVPNQKSVIGTITNTSHGYNKIDRHHTFTATIKYAVDNQVYTITSTKLHPGRKVGQTQKYYTTLPIHKTPLLNQTKVHMFRWLFCFLWALLLV